ncbi:hypothetical protein AMAG_07814 [Allomyces macrogynus ATCC 38327]|uniref:Asn/Gln amidotransferase domain-containing protein n=1 Tax=Allomyces macrogynus (strain ATCC 38327) TaxID=578462 RepID=A0A0L0SJE6_ALLM3|nr:hypothetical protein AMAG_07814 [Allomyces macrogynus ATCC 38327]|eukprot:KNE62612.1 hypothetical protein AMAG_07814 [Allomyces macrogynus ATCC 38327]
MCHDQQPHRTRAIAATRNTPRVPTLAATAASCRQFAAHAAPDAAPVANLCVRPVIGLEFHAQIASRVKLFSPMTTNYFGQPPNCAVAPFDLALPGAMPVLNREPVVLALATALALDCTIPSVSRFEREHYLYSDLAPGYQITQKTQPLAVNGHIHLGAPRPIRAAHRAHRADPARAGYGQVDARPWSDRRRLQPRRHRVDGNRDFAGPAVAAGSSGARQGPAGDFAHARVVRREPRGRVAACRRERVGGRGRGADGQRARGNQEYRHGVGLGRGALNSKSFLTFPLRAKESARDYRFAADADLPPLHIRPAEIDAVRASLPPLPAARRVSLSKNFPSLAHGQLQWLLDGCPLLDATAIADAQSRARGRYTCALQGADSPVQGESGWTSAASYYAAMMASVDNDPALAAPCFHWLATELTGRVITLRDRGAHPGAPVQPWIVTPAELASIPRAVQEGVVSGKAGKQVLDILVAHGLERGEDGQELMAAAVAQEEGWTLVRDEMQIAAWAREAMAASPRKPGLKVDKYVTWVVGQVLARSKGRADPQVAQAVVAGLVAEGSA